MEQPSTNLRWVYDMDDLLAQKEPVGMLDKPDHIPQDFWNTVLYGIHHECEAYAYGSVVLQQPYKNHPMRLFTLDGSLYFCKEDMHAVLDNPNPLMKIIRRDEEWLHLNDVLALLVFSPDYRLCLWIEKMYHTYIDNQNDTFDFMMMAFHQVTLDNHMRRMKSLRSHFRKSLPSLIPGATILKKRSCLTKGRVSMFVQ